MTYRQIVWIDSLIDSFHFVGTGLMNSSGFERFIFHGNTRNSNGSVSGITKRPSKPPSTKTFKNALCLHE